MGTHRRKTLVFFILSCILLGGCGSALEQVYPSVSSRPPDALHPPLKEFNENVAEELSEDPNTPLTVYEELEIKSEEAEDVTFLSDLQPLEMPADPTQIVPIETNDQVDFFISLFKGPQKRWITRSLQRAGRYSDRMREILREEGLPEELVYLALIESGFNPHAYSRAGAMGIWQFMPSTARRYGLVINWWIDERRDLEKSTRAAAHYLKDLYQLFEDWYLAAAAYNAGEGKLKRAIKKYNSNNFWDLTQFRYLKKETKNYVPRFLAILMIAKNPEKYGFQGVLPDPTLAYETVALADATDLAIIAKGSGHELDYLEKLNPQLRRGCTPPGYSNYEVLIPQGSKESFQAYYAQLPANQRLTFRRHKIKAGENLSSIAYKFDISVKSIMTMNHINNRHRIRAGKSLIIPLPTSYAVAQKGSYQSRNRNQPKLPDYSQQGYRKVVHYVAQGDSLWGISRLYGVSVSSLRRWNQQGKRSHIRPGQQINVWLKTRDPKPVQQANNNDINNLEEHIWYTVQPGDSLWTIARRYKVTITEISRWNGIDIRKPIRPGLRLRIYTDIHFNAKIDRLSPAKLDIPIGSKDANI